MIANNLVLDVPPGIGLLGMAFEAEGYCVVNGPDLLWGKDMRGWHPVKGVFEGVIGGPPCVGESNLSHLNGTPGYSLAGEFMRIVEEAAPDWWLMEAVKEHPAPYVLKLSPRWIGEKQSRERYFHSNLNLATFVEVSLFENLEYKYAVMAGHGPWEVQSGRVSYKYTWPEMLELQGVPETFLAESPFTMQAKRKMIGNGVPLSMGRAVAKAVRRAVGREA